MKVHKRINYYHNRHRSDGALIEKREKKTENATEDLLLSNQDIIKSTNLKDNNFNVLSHTSLNFYKKPDIINNIENNNELNLTEENIKYNNNNFNNELTIDENYLNIEYNNTSDKLIKNLSSLYQVLSRKENKKINFLKNKNNKNIDEENIILIKENMKLEQEIKKLNINLNKEYSQNEIEKLCDINRKLAKENDFYRSMINKIKISKNNEKMINNSIKYKTDFLVQNMISSMKDLIFILDNDNTNRDSYMNTNMTLENKSSSYIPTDNLDNFTQSSFTQDNNQFK